MISVSAPKVLGRKVALAAALLSVATAVLYVVYESSLMAVDTQVVVILAAVAVCDVAYALVSVSAPVDVMGFVQIGGAALSAWALTEYLNNDILNLADLLNGVTIFSGGAGNVQTIFTIIALLVVLGVTQIVTCFMRSR